MPTKLQKNSKQHKEKVIPYGYAKRVAALCGLSQGTMCNVNSGVNKNPATLAKVEKAYKKLLQQDLDKI